MAVYYPGGRFLEATGMGPSGGHARPLVVGDRRSQREAEAALAASYPGQETAEERDERD